MELSENDIAAYKLFSGSDEFSLNAGQTLKIETSPNGEEIIESLVPEGKTHNVKLILRITEIDA